jgi:hypothetical protein
MMEPMPISDYKWLSKSELSMFNIHNFDNTGDTGFIAIVDLEVYLLIKICY